MNNGTTTQSNRSRWRDQYPHLGTDPLPAEVFTSAERFAREREQSRWPRCRLPWSNMVSPALLMATM
jgi:hypothetical protein